MAGEKVLHTARIHWNGYLGPAALAVALLAAGGIFHALLIMLGVTALVCVPWLLAVHLKRMSSEFAVTDRRILIKVGLLGHSSSEVLLDRIEGVQVVQSIVDRLLDRGTLVFTGTGGNRTELKNISRPLEFRRGVQAGIEALERSRTRNGPRTGAAA
jgi:uncharacterized membrane protein YdbT with pleckstrin-like domain